MELSIFQVDAFTDHVFGGNPAAVIPLTKWLDKDTLQAIALENNLSETAFVVAREDGSYDLRWFTPALEVDLCGHATLAAAQVVFSALDPARSEVTFHSRSGELTVVKRGDALELDFPTSPPTAASEAERDALTAALGAAPREVHRSSLDYALAVFETEAEVRELSPDYRALGHLDALGVIATAPGEEHDFVSRFFAPRAGIDEDPVTGSAHCVSTPYWVERLGRNPLRARQISARGGELSCEVRGDRVAIAGNAVLYLQGRIRI